MVRGACHGVGGERGRRKVLGEREEVPGEGEEGREEQQCLCSQPSPRPSPCSLPGLWLHSQNTWTLVLHLNFLAASRGKGPAGPMGEQPGGVCAGEHPGKSPPPVPLALTSPARGATYRLSTSLISLPC